MAQRGDDEPPYAAARALAAWAALNWGYLRGRLLLQGAPVTGYSARDVLDMAFALFADGFNGLINPLEVRDNIEKALSQSMVDRETFGMDAAEVDAIPSAPMRTDHHGGRGRPARGGEQPA